MRLFEQKAFRIVGYSVFFLLAFVFFLVVFFPVDRLKAKAEQELSRELKKDVKIGDIGVSILGNVVLSSIEIDAGEAPVPASAQNAPGKGPKKPRRLSYLVDELVVDVGILGLLLGGLDVKADVEAFGGNLSVAYDGPMPSAKKDKKKTPAKKSRGRKKPKRGKPAPDEEDPKDEEEAEEEPDEGEPLAVSVHAEDLRLDRIHDLRNLKIPVMGMDLTMVVKGGDLLFDFSAETETGDFADAMGEMTLSLKDLSVSNAAITPLVIRNLTAEAKIEEGVASIDEFEFKAKEMELQVSGIIGLADPISGSNLNLYVKVKISDAYLEKNFLIKSALSNPAAKKALRDDGYFGFRLTGTFDKPRFAASKQDPSARKDRAKSNRKSSSRRKPAAAQERKPSVRPRKPDRASAREKPRIDGEDDGERERPKPSMGHLPVAEPPDRGRRPERKPPIEENEEPDEEEAEEDQEQVEDEGEVEGEEEVGEEDGEEPIEDPEGADEEAENAEDGEE